MKWEYETVLLQGLTVSQAESKFNGLGSMGFELVSVSDGVAYLKRPIYPAMDYQKWIKDSVKVGINEDS